MTEKLIQCTKHNNNNKALSHDWVRSATWITQLSQLHQKPRLFYKNTKHGSFIIHKEHQ